MSLNLYPYAVATLPYLEYEADPPLTPAEFLESVRNALSDEDYARLIEADIVPERIDASAPELLRRWQEWEMSLRNELARLRAPKVAREPDGYLRDGGGSAGLYDVARDAIGQENPAIAEDILNRSRWRFLEGIEFGHYFDLEKLIGYYLRLQLLARKSLFKEEQGAARFEEIYQTITESLGSPLDSGSHRDSGQIPGSPSE